MFDKAIMQLEKELIKRTQAIQDLLTDREVQVDVDIVEDQPPVETDRAPDAFVAKDPIFGGASAMQKFASMTAPVVEPFAKRQQDRQRNNQRSRQNVGAASEEDKKATVLVELEDVYTDQFPGYYYTEDY